MDYLEKRIRVLEDRIYQYEEVIPEDLKDEYSEQDYEADQEELIELWQERGQRHA